MNETPQTTYWPLGQLILARVREFIREPEALFWVYGFPLVMTVLLGLAFRNQSVEQITVDIVESPQAAAASEALSRDELQERFRVKVVSPEVARLHLRTGKTDVIVISSTDEESSGDAHPRPRFEYQFDPTRPQSVLARGTVDDQLQRASGREDVAEVTLTPIEEPGGRYIDFLVPGLVGMGLMGGGLWGVGFVTVDMRIRKLLKRFVATPMKKGQFLTAIMVSRLLFMIPEVLVLLVFSRVVFKVVNHGSLLALTTLIVIGGVMFAGIGLLVASRPKTIEAVSGLMNMVMLPMWLLSGIFFSADRFPEPLQPVIKAIPLTPLIDSLRAVMLEAQPLTTQLPRIAIMLAWALVCFALALKWFRWQ